MGGTWRDNRYPGAACDVPSALYSFSFRLNPDWSRTYAPQDEIRRYLEDTVDALGLRDRITLGCGVRRAAWDGGRWRLDLADGRCVSARVVIAGVGALRDPKLPDIPGIGGFDGPSMHSARWDSSVPLAGKRVGVVGTGASAIQIAPKLAPIAAALTVYQRTPPWIHPRADRSYGPIARRLNRVVPGWMKARRFLTWLDNERYYPIVFGRWHAVGRRVGEPLLRRDAQRRSGGRAAPPDERLGCKRILLSDDWYPMLRRDNVRLETRRIAEVLPQGFRLSDGTVEALDAIVWCTGFQVDRPMGELAVRGAGGIDLATWWGHRPRAYLGIQVPRFPNLFLLLGPNTALGHSSVVLMIEAQIRYVVSALDALDARPGYAVDVGEDTLQAFIEDIDRRHRSRVWSTGCDSWYLSNGDNFTIWPGSTPRYLARTWRFRPERARWVASKPA